MLGAEVPSSLVDGLVQSELVCEARQCLGKGRPQGGWALFIGVTSL